MKEEQIIQRKIKWRKSLSLEEQLVIFDMDEPSKWIRRYLRSYKIYFPEVERKIVELNNVNLLSFYFRNYTPKASTVEYMFETKNTTALSLYLKYNLLSVEDQIRMLKLKDVQLLKTYVDNWYMEPEAQKYLLENSSKQMLRTYIGRHAFTAQLEVEFVEKNITPLLMYYVRKHHLHKEARGVMFRGSHPDVIQLHTNIWGYPKAWNKN